MLHQITVTFLRQRWELFNQIRVNKQNKWWIHVINMNIDFGLTLTPIFMSITFADYNIEMCAAIILFVGTLVLISEMDNKGNIIVNFFKHVNPRPCYLKFQNQKILDFMKKLKGDIINNGEENKEKPRDNSIIYFGFISYFRAIIVIATVISILAVDFPAAYPRRFCKTEEYGISLVRMPYY